MLDSLFGDMIERFAEMYTRLYMDNARTVNSLIDSGLKVPREFRMAAEYTLSRQFNAEIRAQRRSRDPDRYLRAREIVREAAQGGYDLDLSESEELFGEMLTDTVRTLAWKPSEQSCRDALDLIALAGSLEINLPMDRSQIMLFEMLQREDAEDSWAGFRDLFHALLEELRLVPVRGRPKKKSGAQEPSKGDGDEEVAGDEPEADDFEPEQPTE